MTQTSDDSSNPLGALLQLPGAIAAELVGVLPKLADRTRAQVDFAATVLEKLRCGDLGARLGSSSATEHLADVVPFERRTVTAEDSADEPTVSDRVPVEVTTLPASPRRATTPATKAPAKTAPAAKKVAAKKAPAKKAPVARKAAVKKAVAKKAPAKKASAKKTSAAKTKAPAKQAAAKKAPAPAAPAAPAGPITVDALAIPGYDTLAASQVVPRLESLSAADLETVRRYEQAGRGRHTILGRIAQLQAG